jgi:4-aminobutyrate aminotransferase-like enzyme
MPGDLDKVFFTLGGAEAIENAIKLARHYTGRTRSSPATAATTAPRWAR